jgi:hypothetical protein
VFRFAVGRPKHLPCAAFTDLRCDVVDAEAGAGCWEYMCKAGARTGLLLDNAEVFTEDHQECGRVSGVGALLVTWLL